MNVVCMLVCLHMHVCVFLRSRISEIARPNFAIFVTHIAFAHSSVLVWCFSPLAACDTLCTSGFMLGYRDVSIFTQWPDIANTKRTYAQSYSLSGSTGGEV